MQFFLFKKSKITDAIVSLDGQSFEELSIIPCTYLVAIVLV